MYVFHRRLVLARSMVSIARRRVVFSLHGEADGVLKPITKFVVAHNVRSLNLVIASSSHSRMAILAGSGACNLCLVIDNANNCLCFVGVALLVTIVRLYATPSDRACRLVLARHRPNELRNWLMYLCRIVPSLAKAPRLQSKWRDSRGCHSRFSRCASYCRCRFVAGELNA